MKPSGPGLLFAGRFLITVSISMLVMGLLRSSISSWFSFGKLYFSKNLSISSKSWTTFYMQKTGMTQALIYLSIFLLIYFLSFSGFVRNEGRSSKLMEIGIAWHESILNTKYIGDNEGEDIAFEVLLIVLFF